MQTRLSGQLISPPSLKLVMQLMCQANGRELPVLACLGGRAKGPQAQVSGRGSLPHILLNEPESRTTLASAAESPVRSSELLGAISRGLEFTSSQ